MCSIVYYITPYICSTTFRNLLSKKIRNRARVIIRTGRVISFNVVNLDSIPNTIPLTICIPLSGTVYVYRK